MRRRERKNPERWYKGELKDCAICGFTYHKRELFLQRGKLVCKKCVDMPGHLPEGKTFS